MGDGRWSTVAVVVMLVLQIRVTHRAGAGCPGRDGSTILQSLCRIVFVKPIQDDWKAKMVRIQSKAMEG